MAEMETSSSRPCSRHRRWTNDGSFCKKHYCTPDNNDWRISNRYNRCTYRGDELASWNISRTHRTPLDIYRDNWKRHHRKMHPLWRGREEDTGLD